MPRFAPILFSVLLAGCAGKVDFNAEIRPILNTQCVACHGGVKTSADLNLQFRDLALLGGESGEPAIVPGNADASAVMRMITHADAEYRMPKDGQPLTEEQIDLIRRWINQGAEWESHWAYEAPVRPDVSGRDGLSPIDLLIRERLEEIDLEPAPEAGCEVLARRVSLDLIGLPASPERVAGLCSTGNYEGLVDELLADSAFGERWTALWLDLARYADSKGYEADRTRSIWRYRDWLIEAFNADMPFDRFTIEQLAGDLLPDPTTEQLIATAFNRNTMTNEEGGTDDEEHRLAQVIDRVGTTWEVFQGTTMRCVQCHGHPYDPFVQEDFYRSLALFNNTADWDQPSEEPVLLEFEVTHAAEGTRLQAELKAADAEIESFVSSADMQAVQAEWETQLDQPEVNGRLLNTSKNEVLRIAAIPATDRSPYQAAFIRDRFAEAHASTEELRKQRGDIRRALFALEPVQTPVMQELPPEEARVTRLFERGSFLTQLEPVSGGVPAVFPASADTMNRLAFAEWLVSEENPLTARVTVNRFWEQLFGMGIGETTDDFGTVGLPPSHPELLDWLAVSFREDHAWSVKGILKEMVMSATYRQESTPTAEKLEKDPNNRLLSRGPRFRLSAEQLRDQALAVSGLLSSKQGGPSVMPPQPDGIWKNPYNGQQWVAAEGEDRYRRAIYTYMRRTGPYPSMLTFDAPSREFCVSRRIRTNTPLQALVTLNDPAFWEAAEGLARRMEAAADSPAAQAALGYQLALGRPPSAATRATLTALAEEAPLPVVANTIMNLDAFLTKE
ncbi:MAG: PSD1 and planctomycete cytochrome C domain-containing protein [Bacteroidetes bacterium]|nr:PSD1 and planctomycete cytochrome C domain-containing protein [Bacteroidota bacterium]